MGKPYRKFASACIRSAANTLMLCSPPFPSRFASPSLSRCSLPLPACILGCYVNEASMRLEEEWEEANAATVDRLSSIADLAMIEELSIDEADDVLELEDSNRRHSAVLADNEEHERLLALVTAADDAQDEKIQLWRRQCSSSSDEESGEHDSLEGKYDDGSDDCSAYSDDSSRCSAQLSNGDTARASSSNKRINRELVVTTRAMKRRAREKREQDTTSVRAESPPCQLHPHTLEEVGSVPNSASEEERRASQQQPHTFETSAQHICPLVQQMQLPGRDETSAHSDDGSDRSPVSPPQALISPPTSLISLIQPASAPPATISCQPLPTESSSLPRQRPQEERVSFNAALAGSTVIAASSLQPEQVTLAEHAAQQREWLRGVAKDIRKEGRQAHEQQQQQQTEERQVREASEMAVDASMAMWLAQSRTQLKSVVKRRRILADASRATDDDSSVKSELADEQLSGRSSSGTDSGRPATDKPRSGTKLKSSMSHQKGGRYQLLPGMPAVASPQSKQKVGRDSKPAKQQKSKKRKEVEEEEWIEEQVVVKSQQAQHAACWLLADPPPASFFPRRDPDIDIRSSPILRRRHDSGCGTVSSISSESVASNASTCSKGGTNTSGVERDEQTRRERARTASHFSFLGR